MNKQWHLTLAGYQGPASVHTRGLEALRNGLQHRVGDRLTVTMRANVGADGINIADLPGLTEAGEVDACYIASSYLAARVPALSLFDMPFAAPDHARALDLADGPLGARFGADLAGATNLTLLGIWDNGLRHIATEERALQSPADCTGLVLRTMPNANHQRVFSALGFKPQVIDVRDLTKAVNSGQVDAQENPLTNTLNFDLHGALPVITLTGHLMGLALLVFNQRKLAALPDDLRHAVTEAAAEATLTQRTLARREAEQSAQALTANGARLVPLSHAQQTAWRVAAAPYVAECRAQHDAALLALYDADPTDLHGVPA